MVRWPEEHRWSSCPGYLRAWQALDWVTCARVLGEFGAGHQQQRRAYAEFVRAGVAEPPVSPFTRAASGLLVGSLAFVARVGRWLQDRPDAKGVPALKQVRSWPSRDRIVGAVAEHLVVT